MKTHPEHLVEPPIGTPPKPHKPRFGETVTETRPDGSKVVTHNDSPELLAQSLADPDPVQFDDNQQASGWKCMAEAIKAAQWELVHPEEPLEYLYGKQNIWAITEEEVLAALPPDISYPVAFCSRTTNRDMQLYLAGFSGGLSISVCNRFAVIPSDKIVLPSPEISETDAFEQNVQQHEIIQPGFVSPIIIGEKTIGKSTALKLVMRHIEEYQKEELAIYMQELDRYNEVKKKLGKDKESNIDIDEPVKPFKPVFYDGSPTESAHIYHLQYNPHGIPLVKDEVASYNAGTKYVKGGERSYDDLLLSGYDGGSISALRKPDQNGDDASMIVTQACIPIIGGIQPHRLEQFVKNDDETGFSTRLCIFRAHARPEKAEYLSVEQIRTENAVRAEEMRVINGRIGRKIKRMMAHRMIDEKRYASEFSVNDEHARLKPSFYCHPRHLYLTTEALVEYVNFRKYLRVSIQNSQYGQEEMPFVDRDCGRILRIAGMLHVWKHCEALDERGGQFQPRFTTEREIANRPISLKTLQSAIIIVLFTMQTRRAVFPRFAEKKEDKNVVQLAEKMVQQIAAEPRFNDWIPFEDIQVMLLKRFPTELREWTSKALGSFLKNTLKLQSEPKRVRRDGQKPVQKTCYRLADAVANWNARCVAPDASGEDQKLFTIGIDHVSKSVTPEHVDTVDKNGRVNDVSDSPIDMSNAV